MKKSHCPHCHNQIAWQTLKNLRNNRAIFCPSCAKPVRVSQQLMVRLMIILGALLGFFASAYNINFLDTSIIFLFVYFCFMFIYQSYIGIYFPLEKADDEDLLI